MDGEELRCASCNLPKAQLLVHKSVVMPGRKLMMCKTCINDRMEPRWALIIAARTNGPSSILDFIRHRRYHGKEIQAKEIL